MTKTPKAKARKVRAIPHEEALAQFRKRPGYQAAYDAFEEEFSPDLKAGAAYLPRAP